MRTPRGAIGLVIAGCVVLVAAIGPAVAPYSSTEFVTTPFARASSIAWLGGDVLGRDVLSRTLDGGWELLLMAAVATALGVAAGAALGVIAAYSGGWWDSVIMRAVDVILAFPQLVFALLLVSILGPKIWLIVLAVAISHAPQVARVTRAAALDISERDFVKAMQILGIPGRRIIRRDVLPNLTSVLMVEIGLRLTYSMLVIAGLSFLGFGLQPPAASWGLMINENRVGLIANPWGGAHAGHPHRAVHHRREHVHRRGGPGLARRRPPCHRTGAAGSPGRRGRPRHDRPVRRHPDDRHGRQDIPASTAEAAPARPGSRWRTCGS